MTPHCSPGTGSLPQEDWLAPLRTLKVKWNIINAHKYHLSKSSNKGNSLLRLHIWLGGSSEERKMKVLSHSSPKLQILLLLHTYNCNTYFFQWLTCRMTCKANWPQLFPTWHKLMLVLTRRGCKCWFPSKIPAGKTSAAITQKSAGEEPLEPELSCTIYFCGSQKPLGSVLPWTLQIPGVSTPQTATEGLFWCCSPSRGTLFQALRHFSMSFWNKDLTTRLMNHSEWQGTCPLPQFTSLFSHLH